MRRFRRIPGREGRMREHLQERRHQHVHLYGDRFQIMQDKILEWNQKRLINVYISLTVRKYLSNFLFPEAVVLVVENIWDWQGTDVVVPVLQWNKCDQTKEEILNLAMTKVGHQDYTLIQRFSHNPAEDITRIRWLLKECETCGTRKVHKYCVCMQSFYCNYKCQARDWNRHKETCKK